MYLVLSFILAYLIGSIPSGVWIGQLFYHKDIRQYGSHNIGTTNAYRTLGPVGGTIVLVLDILKGTLGASLPVLFGYTEHWLILIVGLAASWGTPAPSLSASRVVKPLPPAQALRWPTTHHSF